MKTKNRLLNLLLITTVTLMLNACNTKTSQEETNTSTVQNPTTQTTEDASTDGGGAVTGGTTQHGSTAGGSDNTTTTGGTDSGGSSNGNATSGTDDNTSTTPTATLSSLSLTINKTTLNKDETTTVKVEATYSDNTRKEVTDKVEWVVTPSDAVKVSNATLTALKDKATTIKAKLANKTSDAITLTITWVVDGDVLPPEPDPVVNNATLLGVDVNDNGVRDDVERWIYEKYKNKHPIHIDIAMQAARGYKLVLETPERAKEIHNEVDAAIDCEAYYMIYAKYFNEPLLVKNDIINEYFMYKVLYNTQERRNKFEEYDMLLSGDSYSTPPVNQNMTSYCDFNTSKYEK